MKKTLVIDTRVGADFSMDLLWAGLVQRLGPENVVDSPCLDRHRLGKPNLVGDDEKDYGAERSLGYTPQNALVPRYTDEQVVDMLKRGEIERIFTNEREESYYQYLKTKANFFPDVPVVVVAGHDRYWFDGGPEATKGLYKGSLERIFIDDWQVAYGALDNVSLINLSINFDHLWDGKPGLGLKTEKIYDICFMGYASSPQRMRFIDHVQRRWGHLKNHIVLENRGNTFDRFVRHQDYFTKMAQSKICLNVRGASMGGRALRYYEIPYVGSCMLSERFPARLLHPFSEPYEALYFSREEELDAVIEVLLANDDVRECIAEAGHRAAMERHTLRARTDYMFEVLDGPR